MGKTIGAGGFAKVKCTFFFNKKEASHDLTGVKVAVKIINKKKMKKKNMISKVFLFPNTGKKRDKDFEIY